jgi:hypothetical protein
MASRINPEEAFDMPHLLFFRLARPALAVASAAALLTVLAASPAQGSETKMFVGEKICRTPFVTVAPPAAGGYCLITQANIKILVGAKDYYTNPTVTRTSTGALLVVSSPVTIVATDERGSTASGNCTYYYPTATNVGHGLCVYSSGTGWLTGFNSTFVIGSPTPTGVSVIGPYWFDRDHGNGDN